MNNTENKMAVMPMGKLLFNMSFPIVISMIVSALYNIVDSIFVSGYSKVALDAVSLCYPIQMILIAVSTGSATAIQALLARALGEGNKKKAQDVLNTGVLMAIFHSILFLLFGIFLSRWFLELFSSDEELIKEGITYIRICTIFSFGVNVQIAFERVMMASGNPNYNILVQGAGALINIILDPIMIYGYFGFPEMGVAGAAIATVIGQIAGMVMGIILTLNKVKDLDFSLKGYKLDKDLLKQMYEIALPTMCTNSIASISTVFINKILSVYSTDATSAYSVYYKLQQFAIMIINGLACGVIPIVSYNYGSRNKERIKECNKLSIIVSIIVMAIGTIIFELCPSLLISMFSPSKEMANIATSTLRICAIGFIFSGISVVACSILQALDGAKESLLISLLRQMVLVIPLAYILSKTKGLDAIWWAFPLSELLALFLDIRYLRIVDEKVNNII